MRDEQWQTLAAPSCRRLLMNTKKSRTSPKRLTSQRVNPIMTAEQRGSPTVNLGFSALLLALALVLTSCAHSGLRNEPLARWTPDAGYPTRLQISGDRSGELLLFVAFSGGGTRAAAFSYGVLEQLRDTPIVISGRRRRLLDEVDMISGVSGGSFPAAYYALYGDWIFRDFESRFLKNDVQGALVERFFSPANWVRLFSPSFRRWETAAEQFDEEMFHGATFGDLMNKPGPFVLINATDLSTGNRFAFSQGYFDLICSDLSKFPLSVAVTASSAVPVVFSPITLRNFAGSCGYQGPMWLDRGLSDLQNTARRRTYAKQQQHLLDSRQRRYIHLLDGGISDNLGIREPYDRVMREESPNLSKVLRDLGHPHVRDIVFLVVNSQTEPQYSRAISGVDPPLADILDAVASVQIDRYNLETIELVQGAFEKWTDALSQTGHPVSFRMIQLGFDDVPDESKRRYLHNLPTNFSLPAGDVDRLRSTARTLLKSNPEFRRLLKNYAGA